MYKKYAKWSFVTNFFVSVEHVLASHSMLSSMGCSTSGTLMTTNYIGKDLIGQVGSLLWIRYVGKRIDVDLKKNIRMLNLLHQSAIFTECLIPFLSPGYFIWVAGTTNVINNICFIGTGAVNAKIIPKISPDNIGETYANITTLNTIASSLGMLLGIGIISKVHDHSIIVGMIPFLGIARIYSYNKSIEL
jgi:hypothetical protein